MTDDRQKVLNKIQKCMRLSKSSEPHEAAAAFRQAQKLMSLHSISEEELFGSEVANTLVITRAPYYKKTPMNFALIISIVRSAFGVECTSEPAYVNGKFRTAYRYFGPKAQTEMAAYAHSVLDRAVWAAWNEYRKGKPWLSYERGARMGFWIGWLQQVRNGIIDFYGIKQEEEKKQATSAGSDLVPLNEAEEQKLKASKAIAAYYGQELETNKLVNIAIDGETRQAGREAAKDFQLHRPINGEVQRQLGN